jgi:ATP-binding cassette subfamily C protein
MQAPPKNRPGRQASDAISAIAQVSKIRVRQVMLRHRWWRKNNGPLLAVLETEEGNRPVALLQDRATHYLLHDPVAQTTQPVTADVAMRLKPTAHMFIAPFDAEVLTPRLLWRFATRGMKPERRTILLSGLAASLLGLVVPLFSKVLFDDIIPQADRGGLLQIGLLLMVFAIVAAAFALVRGLTLLRLEARAEQQVEAALLDRLLRLPTSFFKRFQAGDLAERVLGISQIRRILTETTFSSSIGGVFSIVNLALLFYFDVRLALLGLLLGGISFVMIFISGLYTVRYSRQVMDWSGKIAGEMLQFMAGIAKLRVAGAERRAFTQWAEKFAVQKKLAYKAGTVQNNFEIFNAAYPIFTSILFFALVYLFTMQGLVAAGGGLPAPEVLSTGSFIAVITAFSLFLAGTLGLGLALISVLEVVALYERARPILESPLEVRPDSKDPGALQGEIEVSHATFRYDAHGPVILHDVSLHIQPGEMVALVGASGSGKSTLFRLLLGLEQPEAGSVYFDGQDLATLDVEAVRRQIGTVLQTDTLTPGDLYKNIVGASSLLTLDDAWEAARLAGFEDDIKAMPMGMHTVVSEGGSTFSGGQQQRLMIARALVHRPRLLLFDEATSALDNRTQQIVSESLSRLQVTRIVIAHRLSTIRDADRIYVFEAGRVIEEGTYGTLMAHKGAFARLAHRQLADAQPA